MAIPAHGLPRIHLRQLAVHNIDTGWATSMDSHQSFPLMLGPMGFETKESPSASGSGLFAKPFASVW